MCYRFRIPVLFAAVLLSGSDLSIGQTTEDTLSVEHATWGIAESVSLGVTLVNHRRVGGVQFDLVAEGGFLRWGTARLEERSAGMALHSRIIGDTLRVVVIDPGRKAVLEPGSGTIVTVGADVLEKFGDVSIELHGVRISDDGHPPMLHDAVASPGRVNLVSNLFSLRDSAEVVHIVLSNADPVAGAQFDLVYNPCEVAISEIRVSPRSMGMTAYSATANPGRTRVILVDVQGSGLVFPGDGPVAEAIFNAIRSGKGKKTPIDVERALISAPHGDPVTVGARGGSVLPRPWSRPMVIIDEALLDPPDGLSGDANGDGYRGSYEDEFVEILNVDSVSVDIGGWILSDDDTPIDNRFRFPEGTFLEPGGRAVLFGGGFPTGVPGLVFSDDGRIGDGLSNHGEGLFLMNAAGADTIDSAVLKEARDQSRVRGSDGTGKFVLHGDWPGRGAISPGRARPLAHKLHIVPDSADVWKGQTVIFHALLSYDDGAQDTIRTGVEWSSLQPDVARVDADGGVEGLQSGESEIQVSLEWLIGKARVSVKAPPNRPPLLESNPLRFARAGVLYRGQVVAIDPDEDSLTYSLSAAPGWLEIDRDSGVLSGSPDEIDVGDFVIRVFVDDGRGGRMDNGYDLRILPRRKVVINEVLADPGAGISGDSNGDGDRDTYEDEFVEILNLESRQVDIGGWILSDNDASVSNQFRFPPGTVLQPGGRAVLFGGGEPRDIPGPLFTDDGRIGDGLSNGGEELLLIDPLEGDTVDVASIPGARDQSMVRYPEGNGNFTPHGVWPGRWAFSPGRARPLANALRVIGKATKLYRGQSATLEVFAVFTDGGTQSIISGKTWLSHNPDVVSVDGEGEVTGIQIGTGEVEARFGGLSGRIEVSVENRAPEIQTASLGYGRARLGFRDRIVATDADGDRFIVRLEEGPGWLQIDPSTGELTGWPSEIDVGETPVNVVVVDSLGDSTHMALRLRVLPRRKVSINEALADPPEGPSGDANGDGHREPYSDEFLEILNYDSISLDISGWSLSDDDVAESGRFHFPPGTILEPGERVVLFGGGEAKELPGLVCVDDGRIGDGLSNRGEKVLLIDPQEGDTVAVAMIPKSENESMVRQPEDRGAFVAHSAFPGKLPYSPGLPRPMLKRILIMGIHEPMKPGELRILRLEAEYSDGSKDDVSEKAIWVGGDSAVTLFESSGGIRAIGPGKSDVVARWSYVASPPFQVRVVPLENRAPVIESLDEITVLEDSPLQLKIKAVDPDGDPVRISILQSPSWLTIDEESGMIEGVPGDSDVGSSEVVIAGTDGRIRVSETFRITVENRPPSFGDIPRRKGREGFHYRDSLQVNNLDGGAIRLSDAPPGFTIDDRILEWRPSSTGVWSVAVEAEDPNGGSATMSWEIVSLPVPSLTVEEILADPPLDAIGDANGDGRRDGREDEFIELMNRVVDTASIGGLALGPEGTPVGRLFRFPDGTSIPPGSRLLLFGGGSPGGFPCPVFVAGGRIGKGLSANGATVVLIDPAGPDTLIRVSYPTGARAQSWARPAAQDSSAGLGGGPFVLHSRLPGRGRFSPGRSRPTLKSIALKAESTMVVGDRRQVRVFGLFDDGVEESLTGRVSLAVSDSSIIKIEDDRWLVGMRDGVSRVSARFGETEGETRVLVIPVDVIPTDFAEVPSGKEGGNPGDRAEVENSDTLSGVIPLKDTVAVGSDYRIRLGSLLGPSVEWVVKDRPEWMSVEETTGELVGKPPEAGVFRIVLSVRDSTGSTSTVVIHLEAEMEIEGRGRGPPGEESSSHSGVEELDGQRHGEEGGSNDLNEEHRPAEIGDTSTVDSSRPTLSSNYLNPFNTSTVLRCRSPTPGKLVIYTLLGHRVKSWEKLNRDFEQSWDGRNESGHLMPSGTYFLVFTGGGVRSVRSITLLK